ncbi:MAG: carboxypeptidase regulatory-like domain-containing protein [Acidobacteriota bacterium]
MESISCRNVRIALAILAPFLLILIAQPLMAQSQNISGTITDSSGAVIPDATVKIVDVAKGSVARETVSNELGRFQAINIQPGSYRISVEKAGFKKSEMPVTLDVNAKLDVGEIRLDVGQVSEVLSVNAEFSPLVTANTMEKAFLVDRTQISELPMNGRNWVSLMSTVPGMTSSARNDFDMNFNDVSGFHALGGRGSQNNFYLDGAPNLDVGDNQSQYTQPSIDSIGEFRVLQSAFNAEYGRNSGMAVAVQTKSGSSSFHGTLYEYLRNDAFDARCVQSCGSGKPPLRYNQFGGNFSGWVPIPKISTNADKKVFFFYNREMTRRNLPGSSFTDIPNSRILNGDFSEWLLDTNMTYAPQFKNGTVFQPGSIVWENGNIVDGTPYPGNIVPQSQWANSAGFAKVYLNAPGYANAPPAPNPGYVRYFYNNSSRLTKNQDLLRVDYAVNSKMNMFFRWVNDYQIEKFDNVIWGGTPFPMQPQERPKPGSSWSWNMVNTFTPTLAAETILSYNHQSQKLAVSGENPMSFEALGITNFNQLYPAANITGSVPNVNANQLNWSLGDPGWHNDGLDYAVTENVSWVKGKHAFKFGFYYNRDNKKQTGTWPMNGSIDFRGGSSMPLDTGTPIANLLLGNFSNYTMANAAIYPYFRFLSYEAYAQDSFKVTRRLTVEYGVRFAHIVPTFTYTRSGVAGGEGTFKLYNVNLAQYNPANKPEIDLSNGQIVGDPMAALSKLGLECDPCDGVPRGFSPAKNFFAPRLGIAYDVTGDGKTAVRGGFAMFNERLRQNNFSFGAGGAWPNLTNATALNGNTENIDTSVTQGTVLIQPPALTIWPRDNTMPTIYSWYAGVQRELPWRFALDISYSGNHAIHLMDQRRVNGRPAGYYVENPGLLDSVNGWADALRPYLGWGSLNAVETLGYSRYNAGMFRLSRRFADNFGINFNYTRSSAMGVVDNDSDNIRDPFNIARDWGPAGYDQPNVFTVDFVYDLPTLKSASGPVKAIVNGWEISGMFRAQSGMPLTVTSNGDLKGIDAGGVYNQLPDLVGDPYAGQSGSHWLNPAAFQRPADGAWGNMTRNQLRLPGVRNMDAALLKNFSITEKAKATFRAEFFNLFNNAQIWGVNNTFSADNPGGGISASNLTLGEPNSYREARIIQLALRFSF